MTHKHTAIIQGALYMRDVFRMEQRKVVIKRAVEVLRAARKQFPFDAIAFRGLSGCIIGPSIAEKLNVNIIAVRKPDDGSHSSYMVEGAVNCDYVIIDDLISSGTTIKRIQKEIIKECVEHGKCVGVYFYAPRECFSSKQKIETELGIPCFNPTEDFRSDE